MECVSGYEYHYSTSSSELDTCVMDGIGGIVSVVMNIITALPLVNWTPV